MHLNLLSSIKIYLPDIGGGGASSDIELGVMAGDERPAPVLAPEPAVEVLLFFFAFPKGESGVEEPPGDLKSPLPPPLCFIFIWNSLSQAL